MIMDKIRIGNDFLIRLYVRKDEEPFDLSGMTVSVRLSSLYSLYRIDSFQLSGNIIEFAVTRSMPLSIGVYTVTVKVTEPGGQTYVFDVCRAFELCARSCEMRSGESVFDDPDGGDAYTVGLNADILAGNVVQIPADAVNIVQTTGSSLTDIMSQDAVTRALNNVIKTVAFADMDSLNGTSPDHIGIYRVMNGSLMCGYLFVSGDFQEHCTVQHLLSNMTVTDGKVDGSHRDDNATLLCRTYQYGLQAWNGWKYCGLNDAAVSSMDTWSSLKIQEEIGKNASAYISVAVWSGTEVADVEVVGVSMSETDAPENVVYDTVKKTFLYRSGDMYINNWDTRTSYQDNMYPVLIPDPSFSAGLKKNVLYKGLDGSVCIASDASALVKVCDGTLATVFFAAMLDGSEAVMQQSVMVDGTADNVYYSPKARCFVILSDGTYYNNWTNADVWNEDYSGMGTGGNKTARKRTYFVSKADGVQYISVKDLQLSPTGAGAGIVIDDELSDTSENAVQNKVITDVLTEMFTWHDAQPLQTNTAPAEKTSNWKNNR